MSKPTTNELLNQVGKLSAELYLYYPYTSEGKDKKNKRKNKLTCLGRDSKTREFLKQVKMPALPLLADNKELRESLKPREKSPLFGIIAGAISQKAAKLSNQITRAIQEERQKKPIDILYRLELPKEGEFSEQIELTEKQYKDIFEHGIFPETQTAQNPSRTTLGTKP